MHNAAEMPAPRNDSQVGLVAGAGAPVEVCITVDTEFSIGGAFANPRRYRPLSNELIECTIGGRGEGLGFMLRALAERDIRATFFVEVLQCFYFGDGPMGCLAERIAAAGHDLQLHLHPAWTCFQSAGWRSQPPQSDSCAALSADELREMIDFGIDQFATWGLAAPIALRAGNFSCGPSLHRAMTACGLTLGSNIALGLRRPADPELHLFSMPRWIDGVLEIPALTYAALQPPRGSQLRTLAITATSSREIENLLWQARRDSVTPVVAVTHPFEFVKHDDFRYRELRRDRINQSRFERLLDFLDRNRSDFTVTTFGRSGNRWAAAAGQPDHLLRAPAHLAIARRAVNVLNTLAWYY